MTALTLTMSSLINISVKCGYKNLSRGSPGPQFSSLREVCKMTTPGYRNYNPRYTTSNSLTSLASHRVEHSWSEIMSELQMLLMPALLFHAIKTQLQACLETCFYGIDPVSKVPPIRALYLDNLDQ